MCVVLAEENSLGLFTGQHERCVSIPMWQFTDEQRRTKDKDPHEIFLAFNSESPSHVHDTV
jgi:hypothetical protein